MSKQPLAEVFGFPVDNLASTAHRYRKNRLCPYNNRVPSCTKDKAENPLGVCSVFEGGEAVITCPIRFRQDWLVAEDAGQFFFGENSRWTSLTEVRLSDKNGTSAGNIDIVLVAYDEQGRVIDFGALEVQAVYISGNVRLPFEYYMEDPENRFDMTWKGQVRPDYLSSSRKRLAPQLLYKGGILHTWGKKQAVALHKRFFDTLPDLPLVSPDEAEIAWLIYDLNLDASTNRFQLSRYKTVYTTFEAALARITIPEVGSLNTFMAHLQSKLDSKLNPPDAPILSDFIDEP